GLAAATPGPALVAAPRLSAVRVSSLAVVRVTATAPATLQARILSAGRTVEHGSARLVAGTNRIPLPVRALALGRYHVQLTALDAAGRSFFRVTRTLVVTRATRSRAAAAAPVVAPAPVAAPALAAPADDHGGRRAG